MRAEIYANILLDFHQDLTRLEPFVESVFHHLEKHAKFYRSMLGKQGDPLFRDLFQHLLSELIFEPIAQVAPCEDPGHQFAMTLRFFSSGFTGIASWWLEKGMPISAKKASQQITRDILLGYLRLIENG